MQKPIFLKEIKDAYQNRDELALEEFLNKADHNGLTNAYTDILCKILLETWHEKHEDILMMLEDIKDPKSIETIIKSLDLKLNYYTGNDMARKAIWALRSIRTAEAIEELKKLTKSADDFTREQANQSLEGLE